MKLHCVVTIAVTLASCAPSPDAAPEPAAEPVTTERAAEPAAAAELVEGRYVLATAGGDTLPAVLMEEGDCRSELLDAWLRVAAGRFAFQSRTRRVCNATAREPVTHAAGGAYTLIADTVVLTTDIGTAFTEARGTAAGTAFTIHRLATEDAVGVMVWQFRREE